MGKKRGRSYQERPLQARLMQLLGYRPSIQTSVTGQPVPPKFGP